jgi:hypothetical protein
MTYECDFCGDDDPGWEIPCSNFQIDVAPGLSFDFQGEWMACDRCKSLIEAGDRHGLLEYCVLRHESRKTPQSAESSGTLAVAIVQDGFWQANHGEPKRRED